MTTSIMRAVKGAHTVTEDGPVSLAIRFETTAQRDKALAELESAKRRRDKAVGEGHPSTR